MTLDAEISRCDAEIAQKKALLAAGHPELEGLVLAVADWSENKRMIEREKYERFLQSKAQLGALHGFEPLWMPGFLMDFQSALVDWSVRMGRSAVLIDCGMGKTPVSLVWAENVARKTNRPVLILTPLAVAQQFVKEGEKFGAAKNWAEDAEQETLFAAVEE